MTIERLTVDRLFILGLSKDVSPFTIHLLDQIIGIFSVSLAWAAASLAMGTLGGEQDT